MSIRSRPPNTNFGTHVDAQEFAAAVKRAPKPVGGRGEIPTMAAEMQEEDASGGANGSPVGHGVGNARQSSSSGEPSAGTPVERPLNPLTALFERYRKGEKSQTGGDTE